MLICEATICPKTFPVTTANILDFYMDTFLLITLTSYSYQVSQMGNYVEDTSEGRGKVCFENEAPVILMFPLPSPIENLSNEVN